MENKARVVVYIIGIMGSVMSQSFVIIGDCVLWHDKGVTMAVNTWFHLSGSSGGRSLKVQVLGMWRREKTLHSV